MNDHQDIGNSTTFVSNSFVDCISCSREKELDHLHKMHCLNMNMFHGRPIFRSLMLMIPRPPV